MTDQNIIQMPDLSIIEQEAGEWIIRLDGESLSDQEKLSLVEWMNQSDHHCDAIERMAQFWGGMEVLADLKDYAAADDVSGILSGAKTAFVRRSIWRAGSAALAASLLLACGVWIVNGRSFDGDLNFAATYETAKGEQRTLNLPDGSTVTLNTGSIAAISFDRKRRLVELTEGEAYFEVAHNTKRPFSVKTGNGVVTAVGTAFSVRVTGGEMNVLVTEGRVALLGGQDIARSENALGQASSVEVSAGQAGSVGEQYDAPNVVEDKLIPRKLDWRDGMLSFQGETLDEVVAVLNRYSDSRIDIDGADLRNERIVAYYRVGEIETMLEALALMSGIEAERFEDGRIRLYRSAQNAGQDG